MKHFTLTTRGAGTWFRNAKAVLLAIGLFAAAVLAVPSIAPAQDEFPWATKVNVAGPMVSELYGEKTVSSSGTTGYRVKSMLELANCPQWAKDIFAESPREAVTKTFNLLRFLEMFKRNPFFTSDGKWIVFDDRSSAAWMVPVKGGEPKLAFDWYMKLERSEDGRQILGGREGIWRTFGPSPDGQEIAAVLRLIDMGSGTVKVDGSGDSFWFTNFNHKVVAGNIQTGEERVIADDALQGRWSHDGRFFVYVKRNPELSYATDSWDNFFSWENMIEGLYVQEIATGRKWCLAPLATCPCFSADDSAVICSMKDTNGIWQIFSIPREGGTPVQYTFYGPNDTGRNARVSDVSPNGQWVLHSGDFTSGQTTKTGLCVCNLVTGESFPLFPEAECMTTDGTWSPDGKKIVFSVSAPYFSPEDGVRRGDKYELYIADFKSEKYDKSTVVTESVPAAFAITGNHPNPFNPSTTIAFTLSESGPATLSIYNVTGQKVRELVNAPLSAGNHSAVWDGRDDRGIAVSSGIYFSRLTSHGRSVAARMTLMK